MAIAQNIERSPNAGEKLSSPTQSGTIPISNIRNQISKIKYPQLNIQNQISTIKYPKSNIQN
jgi:hypothetical protein